MKKTERLWLILLLLNQNQKLTASQLSDKLEVTKRTIYRDIDALSQMGIPIISEEGIAGGYQISPDYFTSSIPLSEKEIILLELLLKMAPKFQLSDFEGEVTSLQIKLSHICSLQNICQGGFSKISLSTNTIISNPMVEGAFETTLRALNGQRQLEISYYNPGKDEILSRIVSPMHLFFFGRVAGT